MFYTGPDRRDLRAERLVGGTAGATIAGLIAWGLEAAYHIRFPPGLEAGIGGLCGVVGACMHPFFIAGGRLLLAMLTKCARKNGG